MSDSDEDLMAESVTRLQHHTFMNRAPNINNTNITSYSFGNNMMTTTFRSNYERQRNDMQCSNQRNMYNRRETSPMSLKSFPDSGMQHFRNYPNGMTSCNRSVFNGRSGSPMSIRSIDSNVSAADIVLALKNLKCNENDLRLIKDAYNKFVKNRTRKRIEKRRNLKLFLKGYRRKSGEDSGEQGSDSSISSDDCRSTRTFYKEKRFRSGPKSTITDITHFRPILQQSDMFRDCTEKFKQTKLRNMVTTNHTTVNQADNDTIIHHNHIKSRPKEKSEPNTSVVTLKDRFTKSTNSFLLPSQRFNMSTTNLKNTGNSTNVTRDALRTKNNIILEENSKSLNSDSDREEIFSEITMRENKHVQQKRVLEDSESISSDKKRYKATPQANLNDLTGVTNTDFNFKKPQMPVRKSGNQKKDPAPERIIAMSKPLIGNIELDIPKKLPKPLDDTQNQLPVNSTEIEESNQAETAQNSTDVSMRPSFIKRKLFTQKLDVAENNNVSSDNIAANSPQTSMYSQCKEKNKVRKLVTSQSCLSRDILADDNVLDLIHKIVPPDKINMTTVSNKKEVNKSNDNDKWDVASVISTCDIGDVSDTFTDEEIFKAPSKLDNKTKKDQKENESVPDKNTILPKPVYNIPLTQCNVVVHKLSPSEILKQKPSEDSNKSKFPKKRTVSSCVRSFWDTDFESDMEDKTATPWKPKIQLNLGDNSKMNFSKKTTTKGVILTVRSLQNMTVNSSMRSNIKGVSKRNIESQENKENNNMLNKNNKNLKNDKKEVDTEPKETNLKNTKSKQMNEATKINNEKSKAKPTQTKTKSTASQNTKKENPCNISRESLRLKQKNETKTNTVSPCNTSRESLRLKQKYEKKVDKTSNNDVVKRPRGKPRKSVQNADAIKSNLNKNGKESKKNNQTNDKPVKKNNTINRIKAQTPQRKQNKLFSTPITDSSFNISNRSLRIRHR